MAGLVQTARAMRERLDHLIEELVCFENEVAWVGGIGSFDKRMEPKVRPKRVAVTAGECTCLCVCSPMNPALWSALPIEVLQLVFARLPLPKLIQLRCLSREWNRSLRGGNPEFMRECAEASARTFALIPIESKRPGLVSVSFFDTESNRWYPFEHQMGEKKIVSISARDGGLVAAVSGAVDKKGHPLVDITVFNLLTGQRRTLPLPHALSQVLPSMVQLVMDHDAKCYKVFVAFATAMVAQVYCSETDVWTTAQSCTDLIFGYQSEWVDLDNGDCLAVRDAPCVYDCAGHQLLEFDVTSNPFRGVGSRLFRDSMEPVKSYALVKDRLFVLHEDTFRSIPESSHKSSEYFVTGFQGQKGESNWVKLGVHRCGEFGTPPNSLPRFNMELYACKGLLLVFASNGEDSWGFRHELTWLYVMSKAKWRTIPVFPYANESDYYDHDLRSVSTMFDL